MYNNSSCCSSQHFNIQQKNTVEAIDDNSIEEEVPSGIAEDDDLNGETQRL